MNLTGNKRRFEAIRPKCPVNASGSVSVRSCAGVAVEVCVAIVIDVVLTHIFPSGGISVAKLKYFFH